MACCGRGPASNLDYEMHSQLITCSGVDDETLVDLLMHANPYLDDARMS